MYDEYWLKGGRGSTKSSFVSLEIILALLKDKEAHAVVGRRYQNELRDSVYGQIIWAINKLGVDHLFQLYVTPMQIVHKLTKQKILFRGFDNPLKIKSINVGSGYVKLFWCEELDQFSGMEELRNIEQSLFRGEGDENRISFMSYNPPKSGRSWVNAEAKLQKKGRRVHHSDYRNVNPLWLGKRFLALAEHLKETNELAYRHEYLGEEVGTGLEIFNNVTIRHISAEERLSFNHIRQGLDFGYAVDPACFVRMNFDRKKRRLYIFDEVSGIRLSNRELWNRVSQWNDTYARADSAEPKSIDELKELGMKVLPAKKGPGSVDFGVKWLQDLEEIIIDPETCPLAAKEYVNYALEISRAGETISRFPDSDNHSIDATRYALVDDMVERKLKAGISIY